ncbi:hypothetical protein Fmac_025785 [Flemingia macrophylla]|uniref:Uncharacterized protein n=1 Tax=Flemingia macrophylla TaxID=520843 RepID=A0ABD1LT67_9FABA
MEKWNYTQEPIDEEEKTKLSTIAYLLLFVFTSSRFAQGARLMLPAQKATLHNGDVVSESSLMPWGWVVSVLMFLVLISNRLHPIFMVAIVFLGVGVSCFSGGVGDAWG